MRNRILLALALLICLAAPVFAQEPTGLKSLRIALWPEFDDPRLLVIIDGETNQPGQTVVIPVPAEAEVNAVAAAGADGNLLNLQWENVKGTDGGNAVSFKPAQTGFRLEYYVPLITKGSQRLANFNLPASYVNATKVDIEALLPPSATNIGSDPAMQPSSPSDNGGKVYLRSIGAEAGGAAIKQNLTYDNPTGALGVAEDARATQAPAQATPAPAPATATGSGTSSRTLLIGLLGIAAVLLVGLGLFGLWRTRQAPAEPAAAVPARTARAAKTAGAKPAAGAAGSDRFCRQCGTEFQREDKFCRSCGATRR